MGIRLPTMRAMSQRIKNALQKNAAYKAWNLSAEALEFFDAFDDIDMGEVQKLNDAIIQRAVDEGMDNCLLRRRLAQINNGEMYFWDAVNEDTQPPASSSEPFRWGSCGLIKS